MISLFGDRAVYIAGWQLRLTGAIKTGGSETQKGHPFGWPLHLFDAWQLYAGRPARHPAGSTPCCAN
ncbi:hypothetical protein, partial [Enterobacter soli]